VARVPAGIGHAPRGRRHSTGGACAAAAKHVTDGAKGSTGLGIRRSCARSGHYCGPDRRRALGAIVVIYGLLSRAGNAPRFLAVAKRAFKRLEFQWYRRLDP